MNRPNRNQIEQELIDANRMYYGSTIEDEYHKRLEKYVDYLETKAENLPISSVTPRFCFICGSELKDEGHDWLQCESEECAEMFRTYKDDKGNQHVMMIRTPFTPK